MSAEKKIIIDEDWKAQVAAEKEQLVGEAPSGEGASAPGDNAPAPTSEADLPWPPASFDLLVSTFATEAIVALGQIPNPVSGKAELHAERARYAIDMLVVIQ